MTTRDRLMALDAELHAIIESLEAPDRPAPIISDAALLLILSHEGFDKPGNWPGASSGITLPIGYDLGYKTVEEFTKDWKHNLPEPTFQRLRAAIGIKGAKAKALAPQFKDIQIDPEVARRVFETSTIPKYVAAAKRAFPGLEALPFDAQGALVSLVFNRGTSMTGDTRREMRTVRDGVREGDLQKIADAIRSMKRLWEGKGLGGLLRRRDDEAAMVERSMKGA